jgi:large subunit ribosomal protein L24
LAMKFGAHLSPELREKYRKRALRPRVGDTVKIIRGEFKDIEGKVTKVLAKEGRLTVDGVAKEKTAGGTAPIPIDTSNVVITSLNMDDKSRKSKLEAQE